MKQIIIILLILVSNITEAQSFQDIGWFEGAVVDLYGDSVTHELYAAGDITPDIMDSTKRSFVYKWKNNEWIKAEDNIQGAYARGFTKFKGEYYIAGKELWIAPDTAYNLYSYLCKYNGQTWVKVDSFYGQIFGLYVDSAQEKMYIRCHSDRFRGMPNNGFVVYDGTEFSLPYPIFEVDGATISAFAQYKGQFYMSGNFNGDTQTELENIARWDGTQWQGLASGIDGGGHMIVYKGNLIVACFRTIGSNPIETIAKWDGTEWSDLAGIKPYPDGGLGNFSIYNGELYVSWSYWDPANNAITHVCKWNGSTWSVIGHFNEKILSMEVFEGGLYIGGMFSSVNGVPIHGIVKYSPLTGITDPRQGETLKLYPNPATTTLNCMIPEKWLNQSCKITLSDYSGRVVFQNQQIVNAPFSIPVASLPAGAYVLKVESDEGVITEQWWKE